MVRTPRVSNFVLEEASQPTKTETIRGRDGDDDVPSFAATHSNLGTAARTRMRRDDNDVASTTRTESPQTLRKELAKVRGLVPGAVVEREGRDGTRRLHVPSLS